MRSWIRATGDRIPLPRLGRGWKANAAYAVTFVLLAALGAWWTVLLARLLEENYALQLHLYGPIAQVVEAHDRKRSMLLGESGALMSLTLALVAMVVHQARREREQAMRLEGILAASTHELKTPIAAIKSLLESLESGVLPPDRAKPYLAKGLDACDRLEHLVEAILAYQSAVARGQTAEVRPLVDFLEPVLEHRLGTVGGDEIIEVELGELAALPVLAAEDPFRVVMENLLDNARKYGNGTPTVVTARLDGACVHVDVKDGGDGFEPGVAASLFEPYQRGAAGKKKHGTGLGLYIARSLARSMKGDLSAKSDGPGKGATFTLSLRRAAATPEA